MTDNGTGNNKNSSADSSSKRPVNTAGNPRPAITGTRVISYNLREEERPVGIKVRFKIRVVTGKRAQEIDARQTEAIMEVLRWARQHPTTPSE